MFLQQKPNAASPEHSNKRHNAAKRKNSDHILHRLTHADPLRRASIIGAKSLTHEGCAGFESTQRTHYEAHDRRSAFQRTSAAGEGLAVVVRTRKQKTYKAPVACKAIGLGARANRAQLRVICGICGCCHGARARERNGKRRKGLGSRTEEGVPPPACSLPTGRRPAGLSSRDGATCSHIPAGFYRATSPAPDRLSALTTAVHRTMPPASSDRLGEQ